MLSGTARTYLLLGALHTAALPTAAGQAADALQIVVVEGQGAINNIAAGRAKEPVVYVKDERNRPVSNAAVTFAAPAAGPGGLFGNGSPILSVTTDAEGKAVGRGFRPNRIAGPFDIRITANEGGRRASASLRQTNASVARSGSGRKRALLIAILGGAAVAAVVGVAGGGSSSPSGPATPAALTSPSAALTPGTPSIGAP